MLRNLCVLLLAIGIAGSAGAATLSVSPDKLTYNVGEPITLTVTADDGGAAAYQIVGRLDYSGALVNNGTRSQTILVPTRPASGLDADLGWAGREPLNAFDDGTNAWSDAFNQDSGKFEEGADNLPGTLSVVTLIASAAGVVDVNWQTISPYQLDFFGLTSAPGTSFTIVPEPAAAALIMLGLLGLAGWRRVRE